MYGVLKAQEFLLFSVVQVERVKQSDNYTRTANITRSHVLGDMRGHLKARNILLMLGMMARSQRPTT